ncbi:hypothetical protein ACJX0J_021496, partial [Zea mays]
MAGFCVVWALFWLAGSATVSTSTTAFAGGEAVVMDARSVVAVTDNDFVCATLDWWLPENSFLKPNTLLILSYLQNLSNRILVNTVKAFSPLKLRLGGSLQDMYDTGDARQPSCAPFAKNASAMFGFSQGCLPLRRWDELNAFFQRTGAKIVFGLNALNGRVPMPDGSLGGVRAGNELSGSGVGARVDADQYAADVIALKRIIDSTYHQSSSPAKPLVLAPGGFFDAAWFTELVGKTKPEQMDVITHHIYNLGPGVDDHLVQKILDPSYLDGEASTFSDLEGILRSAGTSTVAWVGEAGGAYNSGRHLPHDWYLDQLGMSSKYGTKSYCRQTLVGGNYGLLNTTTFEPNPDYYNALLWHRLMGTKVLSATFNGTNKIRAYAHCAKRSGPLLLINLDGNSTNRIHVTSQGAQAQSARRERAGGRLLLATREEYHLAPKDGDLQSQQVLLNGHVLATDADGDIPELEPVRVDGTQPVTV